MRAMRQYGNKLQCAPTSMTIELTMQRWEYAMHDNMNSKSGKQWQAKNQDPQETCQTHRKPHFPIANAYHKKHTQKRSSMTEETMSMMNKDKN